MWSFAAVGMTACSDVRHDTFEIELTTDTDPHIVQLWHISDEHSTKLKPAYVLSFPQSYYAYRDNHEARNQTAIGLLLDRATLRPLTEVIGDATGIKEPLSTPRHKGRRPEENGA